VETVVGFLMELIENPTIQDPESVELKPDVTVRSLLLMAH